jgi:hypothetical protein
LQVSSDRAATMFFMNLQSWKDHPFIRGNYPPALIDRLEEELSTFIRTPDDGIKIEWGMRQIVYQRT